MKMTREERERQLQEMATTQAGRDEIHRLYQACFPSGDFPPRGTLVIKTILDHEYPVPR